MSTWISIAISMFFGASALLITVAKLKDDERARVWQTLGLWSAKTKRILNIVFYTVGLVNSAIGLAISFLSSKSDINRWELAIVVLHLFVIALLVSDLILNRIFNRLDKQAVQIKELQQQLTEKQSRSNSTTPIELELL